MVLSKTSIWDRIRSFTVPITGSKRKVYLLAILNFFAFGFGTIISGVFDGCADDIIIGLLQTLPVIGWAWSIIWGYLMIFKRIKMDGDARKQLKHRVDEP